MGLEFGIEIAKGLAVSKSLTSINLNHNSLGPQGGKAIAEAISVSKSLTSINLYWNDIGPEGAKALGPAIAVSKSLTEINLQDNIWPKGPSHKPSAHASPKFGPKSPSKSCLARIWHKSPLP